MIDVSKLQHEHIYIDDIISSLSRILTGYNKIQTKSRNNQSAKSIKNDNKKKKKTK